MKTYRFKARIEAGDGGGAYVLFPFDVDREFGTRGRVPVRVRFDGVPYTGSLFKYGDPLHMLPIPKGIRERIGKAPGDMVEIELERDEAERTLEIPEDFAAMLREHKLESVFEELSFSRRKKFCQWVSAAKRAETRSRRLAIAAEILRAGVITPP